MADRDQSHTSNRRSFASMDEQKQREIASKGGHASGGISKNDPARHAWEPAARVKARDCVRRPMSAASRRIVSWRLKPAERAASIATAAMALPPPHNMAPAIKAASEIFAEDRANAPLKPAAGGGEHSHDKR